MSKTSKFGVNTFSSTVRNISFIIKKINEADGVNRGKAV